MQNKTTFIVSLIATLMLGIALGGLLTVNHAKNKYERSYAVHRMPDGSMMGTYSTMDMDDMMGAMTAGLSTKSGDAFDHEFLSEMIVHHQGAVAMAQLVLKNSKRPELIKLAQDIISAQTGEIKMMTDWQRTWFNK